VPQRDGPVIGVLGGSGGIGASSFAAVLALAGQLPFLVDLDVSGGGIDITLGIEHVAGARWSGIQLSGGTLDPQALADGLPRAGTCAVLAADTHELDAAAVDQVLEVAAAAGPLVVDLPRHPCPARTAALKHTSFLVLVARGDVAGLVAAHATVRGLPEIPLGLVLRRGPVAAAAAAQLIGAPLLGELPAIRAGGAALDPDRLPRAAERLASGVLLGLGVSVGATA
jgi:secretion/DNA translocation related CpaE-like protein